MNRHNSFNEKVQAQQGKINLVFVGDSITQGWERNGAPVWETYYGHRRALNLGIGGDRTQHVLWRLDNGNLDGIRPEVAVVMIGTNNSANDRNTANEMVDGVRAVVHKLRTKTPNTKILLLAIFPRGDVFNERRGKILQVNQAIARLHDGIHVFFQDIGPHFLEDDGSISPSIMPDFLHLSTAGYGIWAQAIEPFLSQHLGDKPVVPNHVDVNGEWRFGIEGPQGMVESELHLESDGVKLTGHVQFSPDRRLEIHSGGLFQNHLQLRIVRDRPQGGEMVYQLSGELNDGRLSGDVTARLDGERVTQPWSARRP